MRNWMAPTKKLDSKPDISEICIRGQQVLSVRQAIGKIRQALDQIAGRERKIEHLLIHIENMIRHPADRD